MKKFIETLLINLYVDDSTNSFNNIKEAFKFHEVSKNVLKEASFELRKWASNNPELTDMINKSSEESTNTAERISCDESTYTKSELGSNDSKYRKVLGINWDVNNDTFVFDFKEIITNAFELPATKRNILKISSMFC